VPDNETIDIDVVREITLALPGVEEGTIHGASSPRVRGTAPTCPALHGSAESAGKEGCKTS
jgi:hypothetical protein